MWSVAELLEEEGLKELDRDGEEEGEGNEEREAREGEDLALLALVFPLW
eukprot:CAMPEP_0201530784 /NCGR_PEP_ID=MMETSP0161_2-20130828/45694_1 /ASSEMBLY_ACC=CAM_ASM_000251 /TAXON_ID=180227 /ORGANISM="Neoparamoeba aestuarina, Strain SoJaBio B1-5/56/2" /LENGTH=48 /DNA_ID= /DNA_START= /DNA_END= /DNA_ORIENTATION=